MNPMSGFNLSMLFITLETVKSGSLALWKRNWKNFLISTVLPGIPTMISGGRSALRRRVETWQKAQFGPTKTRDFQIVRFEKPMGRSLPDSTIKPKASYPPCPFCGRYFGNMSGKAFQIQYGNPPVRLSEPMEPYLKCSSLANSSGTPNRLCHSA